MFTFSPIAQRSMSCATTWPTPPATESRCATTPSSASASRSWPRGRRWPGSSDSPFVNKSSRRRRPHGGGLGLQALRHRAVQAPGLRVDGHRRARCAAAGEDGRRPMAGRAESTYRYTVIDTIGGGASEIQKNIIARRKLDSRRTSDGPRRCRFLPRPALGGHRPRLSSVGPAARATRLLADYGATVVKVGPVSRPWPAPWCRPSSLTSAQRGMRRVQLDVRHPSGLEAFLALAAGADVVIESFRPGVVDRLGIGYEQLRAVNTSIIYCSTSGYGQDGPRSTWAVMISITWPCPATWRRRDPGPTGDHRSPAPPWPMPPPGHARGTGRQPPRCSPVTSPARAPSSTCPWPTGPCGSCPCRRRAPGHRHRTGPGTTTC